MSNASLGVAGEHPRALPGTTQGQHVGRLSAGPAADIPVLEAREGGLAQRFARSMPNRHPVTVFLAAAFLGYVILAAASIAVGLLLTRVILQSSAIENADERFVAWLVGQRGSTLTEASWIGSTIAGGVVIPALVAVVAITLACFRRWRIAGFLVTAIVVEAATYRAATFFVHRDRPQVDRLEDLPANASYPSGHTAASIAVYCGLALLLTSRIRTTWVRVTCWVIALAIPPFVAVARMSRGMHHPLDCLAGVLIGVSAILVALFAARAAGVAAEARNRTREVEE